MPAPNERYGFGDRSSMISSARSKTAGSRLADANWRASSWPLGIGTPSTTMSSRTQRSNIGAGVSKRQLDRRRHQRWIGPERGELVRMPE
jgi:hypothetical protein